MKRLIALALLSLTVSSFASARTQVIECKNDDGYAISVNLDNTLDLAEISEQNPAEGEVTIKNKEITVIEGDASVSFYIDGYLYISTMSTAELIIPEIFYAQEGSFKANLATLRGYEDPEEVQVSCTSKIND